ncbi:MAG: type II toxin-antitoxin system VapC family toxin [Caulobacteraceae bacterium]|nr:type II toxin-antitoxin system VapC family toxin [Caulobacteraceae bacterium]
MVKALLDTNILIDFLQGFPEAGRELALYDDRAISIVSWMEVMVGAAEAAIAPTRAFLSRFDVVGLDEAVAELAVELRRRHGMKLPDAIIWATARRDGRLLVTRNTKDFPPGDPGVRAPYRIH